MELEILGKSPIESNPPCGLDVRYEPEFEELQNEIDKLSSPTGGTIEWSKVLELSSKILTEKSKDLLVTSYLCTALVELKGIEGFVKGLKIYKDMIENFWENLFPPKKRLRGRIRAIEWWIEKVGNSLKRKEIKEIPEELHKEINQLLEEIDKLLTNLLTEP
ncbi:MAG TPA: type VI secretion system protein TssA, partial [Candidatus Desulfofervidus auxilii]|nr:type VI secretion system protein TssA [Candidatus Desulfofervidus auxilii]